MDRDQIFFFGFIAMILAIIWMGWHRDILGVIVTLLGAAGIMFLIYRLDLMRRKR
jgi:hypothetical protein